MFKNIKKASEYSLLSESLIYKVTSVGQGKELPEVLTEEEKTKKRLDEMHTSLDATFQKHLEENKAEINKFIAKCREHPYQPNQWKEWNKDFLKAMGFPDVSDPVAAKRLIERLENYLNSRGAKVVAEGKFGPNNLKALERHMDSLEYKGSGDNNDAYIFADDLKSVLDLIVKGSDYKSGDWTELNKAYAREFAKKGMSKVEVEDILKEQQEEVFKRLGIESDRMADIDGKLGPFTLYAFALDHDIQRPKIPVPAGNPRLEALLNEDAKKAFTIYKDKFAFAKDANENSFIKVYKKIKSYTNFDPRTAKLGNWALALWEAKYYGSMAEKLIGFPRLYKADKDWNPNADKMKLRIVFNGNDKKLFFVNSKGGLSEVGYEDELKPYTYTDKEGKKPAPAPANPAKKTPAPKKPTKKQGKPKPPAKPRAPAKPVNVAKVSPGRARDVLDIKSLRPDEIVGYLDTKAHFRDVNFVKPNRYEFKYKDMTASITIESKTAFTFSVKPKYGLRPLTWVGHSPMDLVKRNEYRGVDIPVIAKLIKSHLEEYRYGVVRALAARRIKPVKNSEVAQVGSHTPPDGAYDFKYKGLDASIIVRDHGPNKVVEFRRKDDRGSTLTIEGSGSSLDEAIGDAFDTLKVVST